jgi:hypothetical protein
MKMNTTVPLCRRRGPSSFFWRRVRKFCASDFFECDHDVTEDDWHAFLLDWVNEDDPAGAFQKLHNMRPIDLTELGHSFGNNASRCTAE